MRKNLSSTLSPSTVADLHDRSLEWVYEYIHQRGKRNGKVIRLDVPRLVATKIGRRWHIKVDDYRKWCKKMGF